MPAVSVLMAFHRVTPFFGLAVESVLRQTERDLELILVDNGTGAGLEPLGESGRDPRIRLISHPTNRGIVAVHNAAVAAARGEFIALLDYDDQALPTRLERQRAALEGNSAAGLVSCCAESMDSTGRVIGREFALLDDAAQRAYTQYAAPVVTPAYAGRRAVFVKTPYRAEFTFCADYDFLARAAENHVFAGVPEVLLRYRHHPAQTTLQQATQIMRERAVVRLLTARRRSGRSEGEDWRRFLTAGTQEPDGTWLRNFAAQNLAEGFPVLAAYHARRSFASDRAVASLVAAGRLFARIWRRAGRDRRAAVRMFLLGPVRALRLNPA
jgi:glycosyltransferase involved in cell wall biosynthesis